MTEKVYQIAKTLRFLMYGVPYLRDMNEDSPWLIYARAAIKDLRDPSAEMIDVAEGKSILKDWNAMIDEASK